MTNPFASLLANRRAAAVAFLAVLLAAALGAPTASADSCPNEAIRAEQGAEVTSLPGCMALEQVSPQFKDNQPARIRFIEVAVVNTTYVGSISADGDRVRFRSTAALGGTPSSLDPFGDWYVAQREGSAGWKTFYTDPPKGVTRGWHGFDHNAVAAAFNPELTNWFQVAATPEQFAAGLGQAIRGGLGEGSTAFSPMLVPLSGTFNSTIGGVEFLSRGSSADSSHVYFTTREPLTYLPGDPLPEASPLTFQNTYVAQLDSSGTPTLELLARDGNGKVWGGRCGAQPGGGNNELFPVLNRNAISADGSRVYFSTRPSQPATGNCSTIANKLRILKRVETPAGPWISEPISSECDRVANLPAVPACGTVAPSGTAVPDSDDVYQGASIEGRKVYFITGRQLADSDTNGLSSFGLSGCSGSSFLIGGCDLYLYDASKPLGERLIQVTAGSSGQVVPKVVAISGDGSHAYFTSTQVLTATPGPEGKVAQAGQTNLYLFEEDAAHPNGHVAFIATTNPGSAYPVPVLGPDPEQLGVGGDGHLLVFTSTAALTADDLDGSQSDVFRYDAGDGSLTRISKAMPGGADNGPFNVLAGGSLGSPNGAAGGGDGSPEFVVQGRWVSEDGETISFRTQDGLAPGDDNGILDSYVYRDGSLFRLPGTSDSTNAETVGGFEKGLNDSPLVSTEGNTIVFQSFQQLLPRDRDAAMDVYALRIDGGYPEPPEQTVCSPDSNGGCQGAAAGSTATNAATATFTGPGNPKPTAEPTKKRCPKGKRKVRRKGNVRCVHRKAAKHAKHAKRAKSNRNANTDRGAGK